MGGGCVHALRDAAFSRAQFDAWGGQCQADDATARGCGLRLSEGVPEDLRLRWSMSLLFLSIGALLVVLALRTYVFPAPLEGIAFAGARTQVEDTNAEVTLELRRDQEAASTVRLRLAYVDGSAKSGEDYIGTGAELVLKPGQSQARLSIPLLPDKTFRKGERRFSVVLENVLGRPEHNVEIVPRKVDTNAQLQLDQAVLNASRLAADIAGYVVKGETMEQLLSELRDKPTEFQEFRRQMKDANENLVRAREAYRMAIGTLQAHPPQQVLSAVDRLAADLKQRNFRQQSAVLPVLGRQYQELLNGKDVDMDRWTQELGRTIPRVPTAADRATKSI